MTTTITEPRIHLAATEAAMAIVDELNTGATVRTLRSMAISMLEALLDFEDTPAAELLDFHVEGEIICRANSNKSMRANLDLYAFHIEPVEEPNFDDLPDAVYGLGLKAVAL